MLIQRSAVKAYLDRDLDSFLWMKKLRREALLAELSGLAVKPVFKTEPWLHQLVCFYIGICQPRFLFLLDMGLGKSKILLDLMTQARREKRLRHACVAVPRLINVPSWEDDVVKHSDLEPWSCDVESIEEKRERLLDPRGDLTLIDYQGLQWALCVKRPKKGKRGQFELEWDEKLVKRFQALYNFIGADESHKGLGNHQSLWFALFRQIMKTPDFCYATTGTLFGKNPEATWAQFYLVDRGETFGETLGLFRAAFFKTKSHPWKGEVFEFDESTTPTLHRMLQHRSIRYEDTETKALPPVEVKVYMTDEQRDHYLRALEGLINAGGKFSELDAQWLRMRQICSGYLEWRDEHGPHKIVFATNPKLDALEAKLEEQGDSKFVICHDYTQTGALICERLKSLGIDHEWLYGGTKDRAGTRRRFIDDPKCRGLVMNSEAGGTGVDGLQKVARYMHFIESPPSPITRKQTEKRLDRRGQGGSVHYFDYVMKRSVDRSILDDCRRGIDLYAEIVGGRSRRSLRGLFLAD